jgi:hypothetical protein
MNDFNKPFSKKINISSFFSFFNGREFIPIFFIAIVFRIIIINSYSTNTISNDSFTYHNLAVNLVKGNGYSTDTSAPFQPHFTREPAFPFFIASIYFVVDKFHAITYLKWKNIKLDNNNKIITYLPELTSVKYVQAILDSFTCIIFFLSLIVFIPRSKAFLITILFSIYFPYVLYNTYILREIIQTFLAVLFNFLCLKYFISNKIKYLIGFSIVWGLLNLTLQVTMALGIFIFLFLAIKKKSLFQAIKPILISSLIMLTVMSPYLIRTYLFYPNPNIILSSGSSITMQKANYYSTLIQLHDLKKINDSSYNQLRNKLWDLDEYTTFKYSFTGKFDEMRDSITAMYPVSLSNKVKYSSKKLFTSFRNFWFRKFSSSPNSLKKNIISRNYRELLSYPLGILVGLLAMAGCITYYSKYYFSFIIFTSFLFLSPILGDEGRRLLPAFPYIFSFAALFLMKMLFIKIPVTKF